MRRSVLLTILGSCIGCQTLSPEPTVGTVDRGHVRMLGAPGENRSRAAASESAPSGPTHIRVVSSQVDAVESGDSPARSAVELTLLEQPGDAPPVPPLDEPPLAAPAPDPLPVPAAEDSANIRLDDVIGAVYRSYPLLDAALSSRVIADGERLSASGEFDLKLKAGTESTPTGFYQTYRQTVGIIQPVYDGGEVFAGYRLGRGSFEPWYLERQTNDAGEFKAGFVLPLARDNEIDARRAGLWRANYGRELVEPEIQAQLIGFVQEASYAYWDWIAAGANYRIAERLLSLATDRTERIRRQVETGLLDPPELTDNLRLVAERQSKLADAERKVQQTAAKLSLFYRDANGNPVIPDNLQLAPFPEPDLFQPDDVSLDIQVALRQRPEVAALDLVQQQLQVDLAQARNEFLPSVDAVVALSQDVGEPTSSKNDKGPFVFDAAVLVDVPLQRRKARGKMQSVDGKLAQLNAKRRITEDKIAVDVQSAYAALTSAYEQVIRSREAVDYAEDLADRERRNFELGASDLLKVTLREQYAAESELKTVEALLLYFRTRADYRAALAEDQASSLQGSDLSPR